MQAPRGQYHDLFFTIKSYHWTLTSFYNNLELYSRYFIQELPHLEDLLFVGNPLYDGCELDQWRAEAARRLPNLKKLDGETVLREDDPPLTVADMQVTK